MDTKLCTVTLLPEAVVEQQVPRRWLAWCTALSVQFDDNDDEDAPIMVVLPRADFELALEFWRATECCSVDDLVVHVKKGWPSLYAVVAPMPFAAAALVQWPTLEVAARAACVAKYLGCSSMYDVACARIACAYARLPTAATTTKKRPPAWLFEPERHTFGDGKRAARGRGA